MMIYFSNQNLVYNVFMVITLPYRKRALIGFIFYVLVVVLFGLFITYRSSAQKKFIADALMSKLFPLSTNDFVYSPGSLNPPEIPRMRFLGIFEKFENDKQIVIKVKNENQITIDLYDPIITLRAPKGVIPTKTQEWRGMKVEQIRKIIKRGDPIIVEVPYLTTSEIDSLKQIRCENDYCTDTINKLQKNYRNNKSVIDSFKLGYRNDPQEMRVGPLMALVIYE